MLGKTSQGSIKVAPAPECGGELIQSPVVRVAHVRHL